jgi:hypothetical protein
MSFGGILFSALHAKKVVNSFIIKEEKIVPMFAVQM